MSDRKSYEHHLAEIKRKEKELSKLKAKREVIQSRLDSLQAKKAELEKAHLAVISRYADGKASDEEVTEASVKAGSLDTAIAGMQASIAEFGEKIEAVERQILALEKAADKSRRIYMYNEAARMIDEIEGRLREELIRLLVIAGVGDHPMASYRNATDWVRKIAMSAESAMNREDAPSAEDLGMDIPPRVPQSTAVSWERRRELNER